MKKIPTLFQREFDQHRVVNISPVVIPELQWVLDGEGIATEKTDGACCAIIDGVFYKRYDAKRDKRGNMQLPPVGAIPCDDPDPVTGHWPHWVKVEESNPADRWFLDALRRVQENNGILPDATYEAIGPHFQSNPYRLAEDTLARHGSIEIDLPDRSFEGIMDYLEHHAIEGIVFWKDGRPQCKIKRRDFGFKWPCDKENMMQYKGYVGSMEFSEADGVFYGKVRGIQSLVSYEGKTVGELVDGFHEAVDDYLALCEAESGEPERN